MPRLLFRTQGLGYLKCRFRSHDERGVTVYLGLPDGSEVPQPGHSSGTLKERRDTSVISSRHDANWVTPGQGSDPGGFERPQRRCEGRFSSLQWQERVSVVLCTELKSGDYT